MARGKLSEEEINILRNNKYVSDVEETRIIYTNEFKFHYMKEYISGKKPKQIFEEAGFDSKILGTKRIERASHRWRESYAAGTLGSYQDGTIRKRMKNSQETGIIEHSDYLRFLELIEKQEEEIEKLKGEIKILKEEIKGRSERE